MKIGRLAAKTPDTHMRRQKSSKGARKEAGHKLRLLLAHATKGGTMKSKMLKVLETMLYVIIILLVFAENAK
jgi:hypothetical protein